MSSGEYTARDPREKRLLHITDSVADDVFDALTSSTACAILAKTYVQERHAGEASCNLVTVISEHPDESGGDKRATIAARWHRSGHWNPRWLGTQKNRWMFPYPENHNLDSWGVTVN